MALFFIIADAGFFCCEICSAFTIIKKEPHHIDFLAGSVELHNRYKNSPIALSREVLTRVNEGPSGPQITLPPSLYITRMRRTFSASSSFSKCCPTSNPPSNSSIRCTDPTAQSVPVVNQRVQKKSPTRNAITATTAAANFPCALEPSSRIPESRVCFSPIHPSGAVTGTCQPVDRGCALSSALSFAMIIP